MSAQSNLAGLYPPSGTQVWNPNLLWQPIPVHTVAAEYDNLLSSHAICPRQERLIEKLMTGPEMKAINEKNADLFQVEITWKKRIILSHSQGLDIYWILGVGPQVARACFQTLVPLKSPLSFKGGSNSIQEFLKVRKYQVTKDIPVGAQPPKSSSCPILTIAQVKTWAVFGQVPEKWYLSTRTKYYPKMVLKYKN